MPRLSSRHLLPGPIAQGVMVAAQYGFGLQTLHVAPWVPRINRGMTFRSQTQITQSRMISGPWALRPVILAVALSNRQVVD
jgi:hypothetical protein